MKYKREKRILAWLLSAFLVISGTPLQALETEPGKIMTDRRPGQPIKPTDKTGKTSKIPADVIPSSLGDIQALMIPEAFGTIREMFRGTKEGAYIFHIQDIHANPEVQQNIAKIIDQINRTYFGGSVEVVAVEGAQGKVQLDWMKSVPVEEAKERTAQYLMRQGLMTGSEYYGVRFQEKGEIFGIENGELYFDNLAAFRDSVRTANTSQTLFNQFETALDRLMQEIASPRLKEFYANKTAFQNNKLPLSQYSVYLNSLAERENLDLSGYPNLTRVIDAVELENKIDFGKLEQEQLQLVGELQQKDDPKLKSDLVQNSLDYRTGRITSPDYYKFLFQSAKKHNIDVKDQFSEVWQYGKLVALQAGIKAPILFQEMEKAEKQIKKPLFVSDEEKKLDQIKEDLQVVLALRSLKLTRDQWSDFLDEPNRFEFWEWRRFVEEESEKAGIALNIDSKWDLLMTQLAAPKKFYEDAVRRDTAIIKNLVTEMADKNTKVAFLITGGFHSHGITRQLKAKNISYAVITPRMRKSYDDSRYMQLMMGETATLSMYSQFENQLSETLSPFQTEVQAAIDDTLQKALGAILLEASGKEADQEALALWLDELGQREDVEINLVSSLPGDSVEFNFSFKGRTRKILAKRVSTPDGSLDLDFTIEEDTGKPLAFQGGVAPSLRATLGNLPVGVDSVREGVDPAEGTPGIRAAVEADSQKISIDGIEFAVDNRLLSESGLTAQEFQTLLSAALQSDPRRAEILQGIREQLQARGQTNVVLGLLDNAENLFEDHLGNGFIGISKGLTQALAQGLIDPDSFETILQVGLVHELRHEAAPLAEQTGANLLAFEDAQVPQDVALFFSLSASKGIAVNNDSIVALSAVFDRASPFVQAVNRVVTTRALALQEGSEVSEYFEIALVNAEAVPDITDVTITGSIGALQKAVIASYSATIVLDLKKLEDNPDQFIADLSSVIDEISRKDRPLQPVKVVITDADATTVETDSEIRAALTERYNAAIAQASAASRERYQGLLARVNFADPVGWTAEIGNERAYANKIAQSVQGDSNIRIFSDNWEFYSLVEQALAFVQNLFRNTEEITIVMTKAEFERVRAALTALGTEAAAVLLNNVQETPQGYILKLPAEILANSEYMNAIENARRILATQA